MRRIWIVRMQEPVEPDKRNFCRSETRHRFEHGAKPGRRLLACMHRICVIAVLQQPEREMSMVVSKGMRTEIIRARSPMRPVVGFEQTPFQPYDRVSVDHGPKTATDRGPVTNYRYAQPTTLDDAALLRQTSVHSDVISVFSASPVFASGDFLNPSRKASAHIEESRQSTTELRT